MENILFYFQKYYPQILLSLFYFGAVAVAGILLMLRRASLFGMVLSGASQVAFLLGAAIHFALHNTDAFEIVNAHDAGTAELYHLDMYTIPITLLVITPLILFLSRRLANAESLLAALVVVFSAALPVVHHLSGSSDTVLSRLYFSEILYNPPQLFLHYLPWVIALFLVLIFFFPRFFLAGFDSVQAGLLGISARAYNIFFFFWAGLLIALAVRTLGVYVALAGMLLPGIAALALFRSLWGVLAGAGILSVLFALGSYSVSFILDSFPAEPVMIVSFAFFTLVLWLFARFVQR